MPQAKAKKTIRPRILFVTRRFPPSTGGMERFAYDLATTLGRKCDIHLLEWGGSNRWLPLIVPYFFVRSIWILVTKKIDIIHMQDGLLSPMGMVLKLLFHKPLTVVIHGLDITFDNVLYQAVVPRALKQADRIFCISGEAARQVIKRSVEAQKTLVIPLGITDDLFFDDKTEARQKLAKRLGTDLNQTIILVTVGRLVKRKGMHWYVSKVLPELKRRHKNILYIVCGEGSYRDEIEQAVKKSGTVQQVKLVGRIDDSYLRDLYNGADIFLMPNIPVRGDMEGFGRVLLEASLCQMAVVAANLEGISEAITHEKNGILVKPKDKKAFTRQTAAFIDKPGRITSFGRKSRRHTLMHYGWDNISSQYLDAYKALIK